jgi:hypothetical protein
VTQLLHTYFLALDAKGGVKLSIYVCLWNNELYCIELIWNLACNNFNFVCVRLCELEKFGCVLVMIFSAFYLLRTVYARLKNCVMFVFLLLC